MRKTPSGSAIEIPADSLAEWQSIVDITARIVGVPAGLIMRLDDPDLEVYVSSDTAGNPYEVGDRERVWGSGLYCETVLKTRDRLLVPNALIDERWKDNPDVKLGMISYLGVPIALPNGELFGTICVLDSKENAYGQVYVELLAKMRDLIESQLALAYMNTALQAENLRLADLLAEVKTLRGILPICAHCKKIRDDDAYWHELEGYLTKHSEAQFTHTFCPDCVKELYPGLARPDE